MSWIRTRSGKNFNFLSPETDQICIGDISHALNNICRFGGHTERHYSVAEHCINTSRVIARMGGTVEERLAGLMHDSAEAYAGDVVKPLKRLIGDLYGDVELRISEIICSALDVPKWWEMEIVHRADLKMLVTEARQVLGVNDPEWGPNIKPLDWMRIPKRKPSNSAQVFESMYYELKAELNQDIDYSSSA